MKHIVLYFQCDICGRWTSGVVAITDKAQFRESDNGPMCGTCSVMPTDRGAPYKHIPMILRAAVPW